MFVHFALILIGLGNLSARKGQNLVCGERLLLPHAYLDRLYSALSSQ
jgi:hypothetical protein